MFPIPLLEEAINRAVSHDPKAAESLAELSGKVIGLELEPFGRRYYLSVINSNVQISHEYGGTPDAAITTNLSTLLRLLRSKDQAAAELLAIEGDSELVERFAAILRGLKIDWDGLLSGVVGERTAHALETIACGAREWGEHIRDTLSEEARVLIQEALNLLPTAEEMERFTKGVGGVTGEIEQLETRIQRLEDRERDA